MSSGRRCRGEHVRISPESIVRFQAERVIVRIHIAGADYLYHETLASLERRLDPSDFMRIHRGTIVRVDAIVRIKQARFAALIAVLVDGAEVRVGRTYSSAVRSRVTRSREYRSNDLAPLRCRHRQIYDERFWRNGCAHERSRSAAREPNPAPRHTYSLRVVAAIRPDRIVEMEQRRNPDSRFFSRH